MKLRLVVALATVVLVACTSSDDPDIPLASQGPSTSSTTTAPSPGTPGSGPTTPTTGAAAIEPPAGAEAVVRIDASQPGAPISPEILGFSSTLTPEQLRDVGVALNSWGGNPSTRYNYDIGHAWNQASDFEFRNTNYTATGDSARDGLNVDKAAGIASRLAVPTLGWVAKNDDSSLCSFPAEGNTCLTAQEAGDCAHPRFEADPNRANVTSSPEQVAAWVADLVSEGLGPRYIAMDNEPDLWGHTHYDVHHACPTYEEILDKYLTYATAIRAVAPEAKLAGPVMCCWFDYWRIAPGPADGSNADFLTWFLQGVKAHDDQTGVRTLDAVDVHYYPQSDVFNDKTDAETNARRLRSTRALWDPSYDDESWITEPIRFIPRMKDTIANSYPGSPLMISEWNFGADTTMNGALAIADVLGIYGREGVDAAAYWRNPAVGSPGWMAFKAHGNYDGNGSRFGGATVPAISDAPSRVSSFAALDPQTGMLRVMLLNKDPDRPVQVGLGVTGFAPTGTARTFAYTQADLTQIVPGTQDVRALIELPAYSITVLELEPAQ